METATATRPQRTVRQIPATVDTASQVKKNYRPLRVAAFCRVSTQQEEQLNSYGVQVRHYTETEQGKYCGKYALTELLLCGECGTPYRRCTWTASGQKKIVWRCVSRLDYGKKYCHHSPTVEESVLHEAIMEAIQKAARQNADVLKTLKTHIGMGLTGEETEDKSLDIQIRIAAIDAEFRAMMSAISADNAEQFDERRATELMKEKADLEQQLSQITYVMQKRKNARSHLDEIYDVLDGLKNHPMEFDDAILRQILECVIIESKERIKVVFTGGLEVEQPLY